MKCPYCSTELDKNIYACAACGARQVVRRTKLGVFMGWAGIVLTFNVALAWLPLPVMFVAGFDFHRIPWQLSALVISATIAAAGLLWYSHTTRHLEWVPYQG